MIRVLSTLSAVVATVLGVVIDQPVIYLAAAVVLLVVFVLFIVALTRRRQREDPSAAPAQRPAPPGKRPEEELSSLGIMEIRPKGKTNSHAASAPRSDAPAVSRKTANTTTSEPSHQADSSTARTVVEEEKETVGEKSASEAMRKRPKSLYTAIAPAEEDMKDVLMPFLQSLQSAINAHTICLLRQEGDAPQVHVFIEAIVSRNSYARSFGQFLAKVPLLRRDEQGVVLRRVGDWDLPSNALGYYREPIAARQVAMIPVRQNHVGGTYFLLADSMDEDGLEHPRQIALLERFGKLMSELLSKEVPVEETPGPIKPSEQVVRPRRVILAEEMDRARGAGKSLAFALVHLNQAEDLSDMGDEEVTSAEGELVARLKKNAPQCRVERFGELTFGLFYRGATAVEAEKLASELQARLAEEEGLLSGGVSIGFAILQDRHDSPESFRADATDALREAYETGATTIVE
jgi:GGDEF domain-containing protein